LGATASLASQGLAAFVRLDSGASQTSFPESDWENGSVTTADQVNSLGGATVFAGIFLNPATYKGQSNLPTPGQYCWIFTGAGRAVVTYNGSATVGNNVLPLAPGTGQTGQFVPGAAAASIFPNGIALQATTGSGSQGVAAFQEIIYRVSNQGV
jgi:hypothetical protein